MRKIVMLLILVTGSLPITPSTWASQYAVQLEASKSPDLNRYEALSVHGKLYTEVADNGYTRTRLGPYENKTKALDVLDKVRTAGYTDAFIAKQQKSEPTTAVTSTTAKRQYDIENFDVKTLKEWKMLTDEQQANLVYLDGKLHVKNGNDFIPLEDIVDEKH